MPAENFCSPVQILRPETRATPSTLQAQFYFPPSPPLTNPHFKRVIPLPLVVDNSTHVHPLPISYEPMITDPDQLQEQKSVPGPNPQLTLLSPPYSPRSRSLTLLDSDDSGDPSWNQQEEETYAEEDDGGRDHAWMDVDDPPLDPQLADTSADADNEDNEDWDEPLFLSAYNANSDDLLELDLFGESHSSADASVDLSIPDRRVAPSPVIGSIPDEIYDKVPDSRGPRKPLFDPSVFDVFENDWDSNSPETTIRSTPPSDPRTFSNTRLPPPCTFTLCSSSLSNRRNTYPNSSSLLFNSSDSQFYQSHARQTAPQALSESSPPPSPSRRAVVALPGSEDDEKTISEEVTDPSSTDILERNFDLSTGPRQERRSMNRYHYSPPRPCSQDLPAEVFQSPFYPPIPFASSSRIPLESSLLFASDGSRECHPTSPSSCCNLLGEGSDDDTDIPLQALEESKLRQLYVRSSACEIQARNREAELTSLIARLNSMHYSVSFPPQYSPEGGHALSLYSPCPHGSPCNNHEAALASFQYTKRRNIQIAVAARAAERRKRKRAKELTRELAELLKLKSGQVRGTGSPSPEILKQNRPLEPVVFAASGSDVHPWHTSGSDGGEDVVVKQHGILQLVARMIFRRRDSQRPLSGRPSLSPPKKYVRSSLSQEIPDLDRAEEKVEEMEQITEPGEFTQEDLVGMSAVNDI